MDPISYDALLQEHGRLHTLASAGSGCGRTSMLGWDLEYTHPDALITFSDQILFRRMNDFPAANDRPTILDCGANIGYTVLHYKRQFPHARITAFEPDPQFAPVLRRNLQRNGADDVEVVEAAAWIADGTAPWLMEAKDGSRLLPADMPTAARVATVDLARYLDRPIDLLKIDIEGAEFALVPHLVPHLSWVRHILVECHLSDETTYDDFATLMMTLRRCGFTIGINSFGPWRDLTRRPVPQPLHARQYMLLAGWRGDDVAPAPATDAPYIGLMHAHEVHQLRDELQRLHAENAHLRQAVESMTSTDHRDAFPLTGPFRHEGGNCWIAQLPAAAPLGDVQSPGSSPTVLLEDDRVLGPAHAIHDDIRRDGAGRYSHWGVLLYLSASDNSNPNTNGRRYTAVCRAAHR